MKRLNIAVIGAGISGLTAAVALHQRGEAVTVYEQATELVEIGAGLSVFANGLRVLDHLGLAAGIERLAAEPRDLVFREWQGGERIAVEALGRDSRYRNDFGLPYLGVLRSHVQRALVESLPSDRIRLDHRLVSIEALGDGVRIHWADGTAAEADVVIAADGARSTVRELIVGDATAYSGTSGFRGIVNASDIPSLTDPENLQFWVGPDAHLLHFPIDPDARLVTFLAVTDALAQWPDQGSWRVPCAPEEALEPFRDWHPAVREMIGAVQHSERWGLFSITPLDTWSQGPVVLIGDAAHGMLPHYGQGANQGMEDALFLADLLASDRAVKDRLGVLKEFERVRKPHTARVQAASWAANALLHVADGDAAAARNQKLTQIPESVRWMHMHDASELANRMQEETV